MNGSEVNIEVKNIDKEVAHTPISTLPQGVTFTLPLHFTLCPSVLIPTLHESAAWAMLHTVLSCRQPHHHVRGASPHSKKSRVLCITACVTGRCCLWESLAPPYRAKHVDAGKIMSMLAHNDFFGYKLPYLYVIPCRIYLNGILSHVEPVSHYLHVEPVSHYPHVEPVSHYPHVEPVSHYPHVEPLSHSPHVEPVSHCPRGASHYPHVEPVTHTHPRPVSHYVEPVSGASQSLPTRGASQSLPTRGATQPLPTQ
ncbi:hypothetical protein Hamer_G022833 [Homarus americanus]|uniref:Uncharacterized protein n=1 Tax=Homarus americanus TaxID=6706 RepID=A0A8J5N4M4_HOMAM|nr:hypothetical protein Hamer_G022833 [Homarus americanus]